MSLDEEHRVPLAWSQTLEAGIEQDQSRQEDPQRQPGPVAAGGPPQVVHPPTLLDQDRPEQAHNDGENERDQYRAEQCGSISSIPMCFRDSW